MDLLQLCTASTAEYEILRQQVLLCAAKGHSYELSGCGLPAGCCPEKVSLGICFQKNGWLLYWQPAVTYQGENRVLTLLFHRSQWRFDRFEDMTRWLRALAFSISGSKSPRTPAAVPKTEEKPGWPPLYLCLRQTLREVVFGQEAAVEATAFRLYTHMGKKSPRRPLSLIFHGPTGVGKSELGKAIAPALERCGGEGWRSVWTELNTFTQPHSVHRLIGAPPGYVGYEDQPIFEAVRQNPHTVFMFDELEKAHPEVLKVFMSILDEGRCTAHRADQQGERELDFRQCVFVFTTNSDLSGRGIRRLGFSDIPQEETKWKTAAGPAELAQRLFEENEKARHAMIRLGVLPEIAGRFSGLVGFQSLDGTARQAITVKQIQALGREYGLQIISVEPSLAQALTPGQEALSTRSSACVLESLLAPLFSQGGWQTPLHLTGTADAPRLIPAHPKAAISTMFPSVSSM